MDEQYTVLARHYDKLTFDVDYSSYAAFADRLFKEQGIPGRLVLELACGTGSLTRELAALGYDMIACDISPDMLSCAESKFEGQDDKPVFICQDMTELDLFGTVDACVCGLDSINYLTDIRQLKRAFRRLSLFLNDGGVFLFDIKTHEMFKEMSGLCSAWEEDGLYAVWQYGYDSRSMQAAHSVDIFEKDGSLYRRYAETHYQRAYRLDVIKKLLKENGFDIIGVYANDRCVRARKESGRLYIAAKRRRRQA